MSLLVRGRALYAPQTAFQLDPHEVHCHYGLYTGGKGVPILLHTVRPPINKLTDPDLTIVTHQLVQGSLVVGFSEAFHKSSIIFSYGEVF